MPGPVEWFTNRVEIPFTKNGNPQLVSLAGIVPADTTSAVIQMTNEGLLVTKTAIAYGYGCSVTMLSPVLPQDDIFTVCECNDPLHQVVLGGTDSDIHAYVLAAFRGPGTHSHATALKRTANSIGELSTWITRSAFTSIYDPEDIEAVLLVFWQTDTTINTTFGARDYGSAVDKTFLATPQNRLKWLPCKVTASGGFALYQIYLTGKIIGDPVWQETGAFYEVGFLLKDYGFYGVEEIVDEDPPAVTEWTLRAVSPQVPPRSEGIFAMMDMNPIVNATHGLRSPGSTDPVTEKPGTGNYVRGCGRAELNSLSQYEYWLRGNPQLYVFGYTFLEQLGALLATVEVEPAVQGLPRLTPLLGLPLGLEGITVLPAAGGLQGAAPVMDVAEVLSEPVVDGSLVVVPGPLLLGEVETDPALDGRASAAPSLDADGVVEEPAVSGSQSAVPSIDSTSIGSEPAVVASLELEPGSGED